MSLIRKIGRAVGGIAKSALASTPVGASVMTVAQGLSTARRMAAPRPTAPAVRPGAGMTRPGPAGGGLRLPGGGGLATDAAIAAGSYAAGRWGRGGGQPARRRRSKGITGSEFRAFKRVTNILNKVCKTPAPMRRRSSSRGRACR